MDLYKQNTILITCGTELSVYLAAELEQLGFDIVASHKRGITIKATGADVMMLNLRLKTAYNVLWLLKEFRCKSPQQLYENLYDMPWEDMISPDEYLSVVPRIDTPSIDNTMFAAMKAKDAIVDRIMAKTGSRPDSGPDRDCLVYNLYWQDDRCWLYLNTSGQKLSDRGYRKSPVIAPMRESLAAGVIMATGYDGTVPFINPMCGSGTLAIEAALSASNRACGLLRRNFGFMHELDFDKEKWKDIRLQAQKIPKKTPARIIATDISKDAVRAAQNNAMTAGVDHLIDFAVCDFADTEIPEEPGIIVMNPEYGIRLGETEQLKEDYARIGDFFKQKCSGHTGYVFTGNTQLAKKIGLRTSRRLIFFNGEIECRLLEYELYQGTRKEK